MFWIFTYIKMLNLFELLDIINKCYIEINNKW